jgi:hypothetical protein
MNRDVTVGEFGGALFVLTIRFGLPGWLLYVLGGWSCLGVYVGSIVFDSGVRYMVRHP